MEDLPKPFIEHLDELRIRLIKSLIAVAFGTIGGYLLVDPILQFMALPVKQFIFLKPTEAFFARLKIALAAGVLLAMPVILFQAWKFVFVALTPLEKKHLFWILPASYLLFMLGCSFGFFLLAPAGIKFLLNYGSEIVVPRLSIEPYIHFVGSICLVLGFIFQMPLIALLASKLGLIHSDQLSGKRRHALLAIYIASALLTPGPDPVTAIFLAAPTYLLFECSILVARLGNKYFLAGQ